MIKLPMVSLLAALLFLALAVTPAFAQRICDRQLSSYFSETGGGGSIIARHVEYLSRSRCAPKWSGTLAYSGLSAEIVAEVGLTGDVERLWNEVLDGLRIADQALVKLGPDGKIGAYIKVMLANDNVRETRNPDAYTLFVDGRCNLVILPNAQPLLDEPGAMAFIMAHELFHCVQNASISNLATTSSPWWVEGSAHWFAHMAQPGHVVETYSQSANHFERVSLEKPLSAFDYSAWPFFAWVAQYRGNAGAVMLLLKGMPNAPHTNDDIAGLLSPDDWDDFAQKYSAYQIKVTDRVPVDPHPRARLVKTPIDLENVGDERDYSFIRTTGALLRYKILLSPGDWEFSTPSSGAMFISEFAGSGDPSPAWQKISGPGGAITLNVPCGSDSQYALVGFGGTAADGDFVLSAKKIGDPCEFTCANLPTERDMCVIGIWEDQGPIEQYLSETPTTSSATIAPVDTFYSDGSYTQDIPFELISEVGDATITTAFDVAQTLGTWGTNGNKLVICESKQITKGTVHSVSPNLDLTIPIENNDILDPERSTKYTYTCNDSTLTLKRKSLFFTPYGENLTFRRQ